MGLDRCNAGIRVHCLEVSSVYGPRDIQESNLVTHHNGWVMRSYHRAVGLLISFDAYASFMPLQMEVKDFGAGAVQFAGKTSRSETAVVGFFEPEGGSPSIRNGDFSVNEDRLPIFDHARSQVKAPDFGRWVSEPETQIQAVDSFGSWH